MRGRYQGGSLAGFLIIGVLLTLVLVGGLYGLNRYNAQKAADEAASSEQAEETAAEESPSQTRTEQSGGASTNTSAQTRTGQASPQPAATPSSPQASSTTGSARLPQSGPADSAATLLVLALVTFAGVHYLRSRTHA